MRVVEIIYRYGEHGELARPRPVDSNAARSRLDEGSRAFAALIEVWPTTAEQQAVSSKSTRKTLDW